MEVRKLAEVEQFRPAYFNRTLGWTIKERRECEHGLPVRHACGRYATYKVGGKRLCGQHKNMVVNAEFRARGGA